MMSFANKFRTVEKDKNDPTTLTTFYSNRNNEKKDNTTEDEKLKIQTQTQYEEMEKFEINSNYKIINNYLPDVQNTSEDNTYYKLGSRPILKDGLFRKNLEDDLKVIPENTHLKRATTSHSGFTKRAQTSNQDKRPFF